MGERDIFVRMVPAHWGSMQMRYTNLHSDIDISKEEIAGR